MGVAGPMLDCRDRAGLGLMSGEGFSLLGVNGVVIWLDIRRRPARVFPATMDSRAVGVVGTGAWSDPEDDMDEARDGPKMWSGKRLNVCEVLEELDGRALWTLGYDVAEHTGQVWCRRQAKEG